MDSPKLGVSRDVAEGIMKFSVDLYKGLGKGNQDNVFFSPLSVTVALATMSIGASGQTASELRNTLGLGTNDDPATTNQSFVKILSSLNFDGSDEEKSHQFCLNLANRTFVDISFAVSDTYKADINKYYQSDIVGLDFKRDAEKARKTINSWVKEATNKKIKDIMKQGSISPDLRLVLVSAIYFKGEWAKKFFKYTTVESDFNVNKSRTVNVHMMYNEDPGYRFSSSDSLDCKMMEMNYVNDRFAMYVILPNELEGLAELEKKLTIESFKELISSLEINELDVYMPKFRLNIGADIDNRLQELGIRQAFTPGADFSKISSDGQIYISSVAHKAFIDVNEEGTEAGAATLDCLMSLCARSIFVVDHPFMFVIYDKLEEMILFIGRVIEPPPPSEPLVDWEARHRGICSRCALY